jgi:1-acyl-sn-glycerol-3-phosphate acyltransferase
MSAAFSAVREGRCVGVFPEGTVSNGRLLRPLSGADRVALAVPGTPFLGISVTGVVDIVRFRGGRGSRLNSSILDSRARGRARSP